MPIVALAGNDARAVVNFRSGLIRFLQDKGYAVVVIAPDGPYADAVRALGVDFHPLAIQPRGLSPFADVRLMWRFRRALKAIGANAMLGFTAKPNIWGSLAAHSLNIPVINNISGLGTAFIGGGWLEKIVTGLYRLALPRSATVFFQNEDDRELFERRGLVRQGQVAVLPGSGVDLDHFQPIPRDRNAGAGFTFLLPARFIWDKGIREYADAARIVHASGRHVRFQLLGPIEPPTPQSVPEDAIRSWEAEGLIDYLGNVDDVRPAFAAADCIVLPSYREGTPRSLLEAAAMALPTITTDVPGCRDAVEAGVTGILCAARSAESLAAAMLWMVDCPPAMRSTMGAAGRAWVERRYDEKFVHRAYREALLRALPRND